MRRVATIAVAVALLATALPAPASPASPAAAEACGLEADCHKDRYVGVATCVVEELLSPGTPKDLSDLGHCFIVTE